MDLLLSWILFPAVLGALCLGCGLALESLGGLRLPGPLLPVCGFAALVVIGQFLTLTDETAELTTPVAVAIAVAGFGLAILGRRRLRPPLALVLALATLFAVYAAPIVASGDPTLAGFIKLDDTATWLTFTDRVMEHGRDLSGLPDSTYLRTLEENIGKGYPVGVFVPFGVGVQLLGVDGAWLIQPYMAFMALVFALCAWTLVAPLVASVRVRAGIVVIAAQPALLFGYYLWGGVKELAAAALIAGFAALAAHALAEPENPRRLVPLPVVCGALVGVLSPGGLIWLLPILVATLAVLLASRISGAGLAGRVMGFTGALALLALPVLLPGGVKPPTSSPLSDDTAQGNLIEPLDPLQVAGIWPVGDFRLAPASQALTYVLVAFALALALAGIAWAWQRRAVGALALAGGGIVGCAILVVVGSPWVEGKALATASPMILLAALIGAAALGARVRPAAGLAAGLIVAGGVLWSNALAYRDVNLAPYDQLVELEEIGREIAGEGPALMTEYSPYGARHFLREAAPESISELRFRRIPLRSGRLVEKGFAADTDQVDPAALAVYRTLVVRRSPAQSRPPASYELVWSGRFYEAWQRPEGQTSLPARLPLGSRYDPVAEPRCADVMALADGAAGLVAATGVSPVVVSLADTEYPAAWARPGFEFAPTPEGPGSIAVDVRLTRPGEYELWLGESIRPNAELYVDGEPAGQVRHELNNYGGYVALGVATLEPGVHMVELRFDGSDLAPGSGGRGDPVGPLVLSGTKAAESRLVEVDSADAADLCGREWDWIESAG